MSEARVNLRAGPAAWLQALPFGAVFLFFFIAPLLLIGAVSFWPTSDYELIPGFTFQNYISIFEGCSNFAEPCTTLRTYWSTLQFSLLTWAISLVLGFTIAYFLAFHVRSSGMQTVLFVLCTIPFWTSNVIRMISWVPLLGRNGLVNQGARRHGRGRRAGRVAAVLAVLRRAGLRAPLHDVHAGADLQLHDAHRPRAARSRRRLPARPAGRRCGT